MTSVVEDCQMIVAMGAEPSPRIAADPDLAQVQWAASLTGLYLIQRQLLFVSHTCAFWNAWRQSCHCSLYVSVSIMAVHALA